MMTVIPFITGNHNLKAIQTTQTFQKAIKMEKGHKTKSYEKVWR